MSRGFGSPPEASTTCLWLQEQLNLKHLRVKLSPAMDWNAFEQDFGKPLSSEGGRLPTRLMVCLRYLKALDDESDESVVVKRLENPDWQYLA